MHVFDHKHWKILESESRKKIQPTKLLIDLIDEMLDKKDVAFDIGAGTGYYTIPLSFIFKRVFAVEMNEKMVKILIKKLKEEGVKNVGIIVDDKPPNIDFDINFVLFANVLHEMDANLRFNYLKWAKNADAVCVIDWNKDAEFGPPKHVRVDESEIIKILKEVSFDVKKLDIYKYHYVIFGFR